MLGTVFSSKFWCFFCRARYANPKGASLHQIDLRVPSAKHRLLACPINHEKRKNAASKNFQCAWRCKLSCNTAQYDSLDTLIRESFLMNSASRVHGFCLRGYKPPFSILTRSLPQRSVVPRLKLFLNIHIKGKRASVDKNSERTMPNDIKVDTFPLARAPANRNLEPFRPTTESVSKIDYHDITAGTSQTQKPNWSLYEFLELGYLERWTSCSWFEITLLDVRGIDGDSDGGDLTLLVSYTLKVNGDQRWKLIGSL